MEDDVDMYSKHSHSQTDQRRIHYIKLKKQMQREEQMNKQMGGLKVSNEDGEDDDERSNKRKLKNKKGKGDPLADEEDNVKGKAKKNKK
jgi:hypothetical protein